MPRKTHSPPQTLKSHQCHLFSPPDRTDRSHTVRCHICSVSTSDDHRPPYAKQYLSRYNNHVMGWASEESCFDPLQREKMFLYSTTSRQTLGHTQPPPQWVQRVLNRGVKGSGEQSRPLRRLTISGAVPARPTDRKAHSDSLQL